MARNDRKSVRRVATVILLGILLSLAACRDLPSELRLVVDELPVNQAIGAALAEAASRHGTPMRLLERQAAGSSALYMLRDGQADLALIQNTTLFEPGIHSVLPIYPGVLHIAFRPGFSPAGGPNGVKGAQIYAGNEGSLAYKLVNRYLTALNMSMEDVQFMPASSVDLPDIVAIVGPVASVRIEILEGYHLHSLDLPATVGRGSTADGIRANYPQVRPYIIPRKVYPGITQEPIVTLAVDMILVARSDADPRIIYDVVEQLQESRTELASQFPALFDGMSDNFDADSLNFPLHEGSSRYVHRDEPSIYEQYAEVADAGMTLLLALVSGTLGFMRFLKVRRKNRIDAYYGELIEVRSGEYNTAEQIAAARARVAELEREAFELLMDEKLAADDSFRIFLTLSDAVLRDLKEDARRLQGSPRVA